MSFFVPFDSNTYGVAKTEEYQTAGKSTFFACGKRLQSSQILSSTHTPNFSNLGDFQPQKNNQNHSIGWKNNYTADFRVKWIIDVALQGHLNPRNWWNKCSWTSKKAHELCGLTGNWQIWKKKKKKRKKKKKKSAAVGRQMKSSPIFQCSWWREEFHEIPYAATH